MSMFSGSSTAVSPDIPNSGSTGILTGTLHITGYHFKSTTTLCHEYGDNVELVSGYRLSNKSPVVAKVSTNSLRLEREFYIIKRLYRSTDGPLYIVRPLDYLNLSSGVAVAIYDASETFFLDTQTHNDMRTFLRFAIRCTDCLEFIHRHRVVHGDIKLSSFRWSGGSRSEGHSAVKLWNFGSGSKSSETSLTSEGWRKMAKNKELLVYMSPEQTGRTTYAPDHRSDIYSLGIVFFILLTGRLPFDGSPLDVLNGIVSRKITPVCVWRPYVVPPVVSRIIEKMTCKAPDDRYTSAHGVGSDLRNCLDRISAGECQNGVPKWTIPDFPLARYDVASVFTLPKTVYGRQQIVSEMTGMIERFVAEYNKYSRVIKNTKQHIFIDKSDPAISLQHQKTTIHSSESGSSDGMSTSSSQAIEWPRSQPSIVDKNEEPTLMISNNNGVKQNLAPTIVAVYGPGGIGKSTLFASVQHIARQNGYIATAKFDSRNKVPYSAALRSLSQVLQQILSESEEEIKHFYNHLRDCLGPRFCNIELLPDLVPELRHLLLDSCTNDRTIEQLTASRGEGEEACPSKGTRMDNVEAQVRFHDLYIEVFRAVTRWRMTTLFLDDLHQADDPSLELLNSLITAKVQLMIFISYRDQEITPTFADILNTHAANIHSTQVNALEMCSLFDYLCDALHRPRDDENRNHVRPLAEFLFKRTQGNIFYITQLLLTLVRKKLIYFNWEKNEWDYDDEEIEQGHVLEAAALRHSDTADVSFMVARLRELPKDGQSLLKWASFVGDTFSWTTIRDLMLHVDVIGDDEDGDTNSKSLSSDASSERSDQRPELKRFPSSDTTLLHHRHTKNGPSCHPMRGLQAVLQEGYIMPIGGEEFKWSHDRISQAAAELADPVSRSRIHFTIAQHLMKEETMDLFLVADHLLKCLDLLGQAKDIRVYRKILIDAGNKGQTSGAHKMAFAYYMGAIDLNGPDCWDGDQYTTTLNLYTNAAALSWVVSQSEKTDELLAPVFDHSRSPIDRLTAYRIKAMYYLACQMNDRGRDTLLQCLGELDDAKWFHFVTTEDEVEEAFQETERVIEQVGLDQIIKRDTCQNRMLKDIMQALEVLITVCYWTGQKTEMYYWACRMFSLSMEQGITSSSGVACVFIGIGYVQRYKKYQFGERIGAVGIALVDKYSGYNGRGRAYLLYAIFLMQWKYHHREALPWHQRGAQVSLMGGDRLFVTYHQVHIANIRFNLGYHLADALEEAETIYDDIHAHASHANSNIFAICVIRTIKALQGKTWTHLPENIFDGDDGFCDKHFITESCRQNSAPEITLSWYESFKIVPLVLYGHVDQAIEVGYRCLAWIECHPCHKHTRMMLTYFSLALIEKARQDPNRRKTYLDQVQENQALLYEWVVPSPMNYAMYWNLVEAEIAGLEGSDGMVKASGLYEQAIRQAREGGWRLELCILHEYAGAYYERIGVDSIAYGLLKKAIDLYMNHGAYGKARHLAIKFERLLSECNDDNNEPQDAGAQTDPLPLYQDESRSSSSPFATPVNEPYTSEITPPVTTEQVLMTLDILDMASILKSSQVMSSEVNFDGLLMSMMSIILENSGADCGAIIVKEEKYGICAYGCQDQGPVTYDPPQPLSELDPLVSSRIVHHTLHTNESIYITDTDLDSRFAVGPWFERAKKKSVICMPIVHKSAVAGCLFIEGAIGVFSQRHITVLALLCQQMGISIANAFLFKSVQRVTMANMRMIEMQKEALEEARKSKEAADRATRLREIFLANMSHEIRTPFSGFYGMISLLAETDLNQEQHELVRIAKGSCELLLQIIDDLLNFSKLQARKVSLDLSAVVVEDLVADVIEMLIAMAVQKGINITYKIDHDIPAVIMADANRLRQIIINLLGNAIKFTHEGEIIIRCSLDKAYSVQDNGSSNQISLLFEVVDTGIGITDEQRKVLFVPFSQVDGSTTRKYGGTGLGLSICLGLVQLMSGHIDVRSTPRKGSNFYFTILTSPVVGESEEDERAVRNNVGADLGPVRVLVVDTRSATVTMIQHMLPTTMIVDGLIISGDDYNRFQSPSYNKYYDILVIGLSLTRERTPDTWSPLLKCARHMIVMHYPSGMDTSGGSNGGATVAETMQPHDKDDTVSWMAVPFRQQKLLGLIREKLSTPIGEQDAKIKSVQRPYKISDTGSKGGLAMTGKDCTITDEERALFREMHILVAEDNPVAQKLLWKQLTRLGFKVECANNGLEAVEIWTRHPPGHFTMAFFDHHMPKCDGVEATRRIRALEAARRQSNHESASSPAERATHLPIITLTADVQDSAREICIKAGMDGYLTKPMSHSILVKVLRQYCKPT